jgi:hypothetical protein
MEEIRAHSWGIGANFTNLIYGLASYRQAGISAANMDHAAGRLDKSSFPNVMAGFFLVDH